MLEKHTSVSSEYWPYAPACSDRKFFGRRAPLRLALSRAYIQANPEGLVRWIIFDVDREGAAFAWEDAGLPCPTWISINPSNGHAHLCYGLEIPVRTAGNGVREHPLRYLSQVRLAMAQKLGADPSYNGLLTKNPYSSHWKTIWYGQMYSLGELEEYIPGSLSDFKKSTLSKNTEKDGQGRNVAIFDRVRHWAYRNYTKILACQWGLAVHEAVAQANIEFSNPLSEQELRHISRSIAKWTARNLSSCNISDRQRSRARRLAEIRRKEVIKSAAAAQRMMGDGASVREIAKAMGVSISTVYRWLKIDLAGSAGIDELQTSQSHAIQDSHEPKSDNSGLDPAISVPARIISVPTEGGGQDKKIFGHRICYSGILFLPSLSGSQIFANPAQRTILRQRWRINWIGAP